MPNPRPFTPLPQVEAPYARGPEHKFYANQGLRLTDPGFEDPGERRAQSAARSQRREQSELQMGDGFGSPGGGFSTPGDDPDMGLGEGIATSLGMLGQAASTVASPLGMISAMHAMATNPDELHSPMDAIADVIGIDMPGITDVANIGLNALGMGPGSSTGMADAMGAYGQSALGMAPGTGMIGAAAPGMGGGASGGGVGGGAGPSGASGTGAGTGGGSAGQGGAPSGGP